MRGLKHLHPKARAKAEELQKLCEAKGLSLLITDTLRNKAEQDALYTQGRNASGVIVDKAKVVTNAVYPNSPHCWGVAFDFCRNVKEKEYDDSDGFFKTVGNLGKSIGLTWGGDWTNFPDKPHLELPEFVTNSSTTTLKVKYGTPEAFINTWDSKISAPANLTLLNESELIRVKYSKVSGTDGYQVTVSTSKTFENGMGGSKNYEGYTQNYIKTCAGKPLVTGKIYYVRVRAYKLDRDKKIWSDYTETVSLKFAKA